MTVLKRTIFLCLCIESILYHENDVDEISSTSHRNLLFGKDQETELIKSLVFVIFFSVFQQRLSMLKKLACNTQPPTVYSAFLKIFEI